MRRVFVILICLTILSPLLHAVEPTLNSLKQTYEAEVRKIRDGHDAVLKNLLTAYGSSLDKAIEILKKQGDPDGIVAALAERRRFKDEGIVPDKSDSKLPDLIQQIRSGYNDTVKRANAGKGTKFVVLTERYVAALDKLMRSLASREELDLALNVKAEKGRVEFIVADVAVQIAKLSESVSKANPKVVTKAVPKAGRAMTIDLGGGTEMTLLWIPSGTFRMGSPNNESGRGGNEGPEHEVTISKGFWMGKYEVTQEQYEQVTGHNPSNVKADNNPVESVSWDDANKFCETMVKKTGKAVRLPTEAEWEYACRAGTTTKYYAGNGLSDLVKTGWYRNTEGGIHPVGQKEPNPFGLYDMLGNVWEWCEDRYDEDYYRHSPGKDPRGPATGSSRVFRGGSWYAYATRCRAAQRNARSPGHSESGLGFRVVLPPGQR
jgi:formylglycine-generating enzyme required for sulfatase activity